MSKIKTFFQNDSPEGINLVLFVSRKGRFTEEERRTFDHIIGNFSDQISDFRPLFLRAAMDRAMLQTRSFLQASKEKQGIS